MINSRKKSSFRINIHPFHLLSVMKKTTVAKCYVTTRGEDETV